MQLALSLKVQHKYLICCLITGDMYVCWLVGWLVNWLVTSIVLVQVLQVCKSVVSYGINM